MNARRKTARLVDRLSGQDSQIIVWSHRRSFFIASRAAQAAIFCYAKILRSTVKFVNTTAPTTRLSLARSFHWET